MSSNEQFSDKKINTGRQKELDLAKSLPIIFMVFVHVLWVIQCFDNILSPGYVLIASNILGRP
ncbi:hypothetical protein [uncultured Methanobrevibacter sp.]|uniref:hypothetical protein n=1 Tax=uncultured Methanobrevibacter sp. TaxID=253161 RepID=UPI0025D6EA5F|nr:hypothetical protein [uncultured Methanobrevibacter sp.]